MDSNGILNVSAKDTATGKSQSIRITGSTRLSDAEKQRMIDAATAYAEEDRKRREQADLLNAADSACYQAEKLLAEHGAQLSADLKNRVESALRDTREAVVNRDAKLAAEREEQLKRVVQEAGATLYAQAPRGAAQTAAGTAGAKTTETPSGQRVVDAEFHERR